MFGIFKRNKQWELFKKNCFQRMDNIWNSKCARSAKPYIGGTYYEKNCRIKNCPEFEKEKKKW